MGEIRCSFCGTSEDIVMESSGADYSTLSPETAMCRSCSESLKAKAQKTEKVYEWQDRKDA